MKEIPTKYIIVKGEAGLGNRMESFIEAIVYAQLSGRRLIMDWTDGMYATKGVNSFHELFASSLVDSQISIPKTDSVLPEIWKGNLNKGLMEMKSKYGPLGWEDGWPNKVKKIYAIDSTTIDYEEKVVVFYNYFFNFEGLKKHADFFPDDWPKRKEDLLIYLIRKYLPLKEKITKAALDFKLNNYKQKVVGVHIRYTDNRKHSDRTPDLQKYSNAILAILKKLPAAKIFLATDNPIILESYKKEYPGLISTDKFIPEDANTGIHFSRNMDKLESAKEALTDMLLLSKTDYLVYSYNSSFGRMAAYYSDLPRNRIIRL